LKLLLPEDPHGMASLVPATSSRILIAFVSGAPGKLIACQLIIQAEA